ncbi:MAG TPA: SIMPL domain-containing protein, partial [Bryobacteraceae bacterium]
MTVTASRNINLPPDQIVFAISVYSGLDATRDDIVAALQGTGITAANFAGVSTLQGSQWFSGSSLEWRFSLPVALSSMKSTIAQLSAAQASMAKNNGGLSMSFSAQGTQISPQAMQSQVCAPADLIADARAQAQKLASAAGQ